MMGIRKQRRSCVDGRRYTADPATWWGQRDRSWGIRSEMHTDETRAPVPVHRNFFWLWSVFQFENLGLAVFLKERAPVKPWYLSGTELTREAYGGFSQREVTALRHEIAWADDPLGQTIATAALHFEFEHGPPRLVHVQARPGRYYLKGGNYGGYKGWQHGDDRGAYHEAHDIWDLGDPAVREAARTLSDHAVALTSEGMTGFGICEYGVAAGYPLYIPPQSFPCL